jgi:hypothetical protein
MPFSSFSRELVLVCPILILEICTFNWTAFLSHLSVRWYCLCFVGEYDARMRVLIRHVAKLLDVPLELIDLYEESAVDCLTDDQKELTE